MELAALAAAGDRRAFGELARRHVAGVRALLRRMGADAALADDLAQDAFLLAFERMADFRGEGAFAGWIKRIAARLYVRRWRKRNRLAEDALVEGWDAAEIPAVSASDRLDLDAALAGLGEAERMCVSLCFGAGLTHQETADALGAPLGTVKSHIKRGLDKLRRRLGADGPLPGGVPATGRGVVHG